MLESRLCFQHSKLQLLFLNQFFQVEDGSNHLPVDNYFLRNGMTGQIANVNPGFFQQQASQEPKFAQQNVISLNQPEHQQFLKQEPLFFRWASLDWELTDWQDSINEPPKFATKIELSSSFRFV